MKLLLLTDGIQPFVIGGMQKHSRLLAEYLAREGVEVRLYHCVSPNQRPSNEELRAQFSAQAQPRIAIKTFDYEDQGRIPGHYVRAQKELSATYFTAFQSDDFQPDFIYSKGFTAYEFLKRRNELPKSIKIGVKFHGMNMFQVQPDWKGELTKYLFRPPVRWIMNEADVVFSYGGKITEIICKELNDKHKVVEIPSGIESEFVLDKPPVHDVKAKRRFLFIGRDERLKGIPELNKVLGKIGSHHKWEMHFVGPIESENRLEQSNVFYHGSISDRSRLTPIIDTCDVLICPSISEGMPNVILEAMARGLAIIATDVGATNLMISDSNGRLIRPKDIIELEQQMNFYINIQHDQLDAQRKNSITRIIEDFTWDQISHRHIDLLRSLLPRH